MKKSIEIIGADFNGQPRNPADTFYIMDGDRWVSGNTTMMINFMEAAGFSAPSGRRVKVTFELMEDNGVEFTNIPG